MSRVYESAGFFDALNDVGDMLAELAYIDRAEPYLRGLPWNAMFQTYDVELGQRYPFDIRISLEEEQKWAEVRDRLLGFEKEAVARAESDVGTLLETARVLLRFDPAPHRETVQQLADIHKFLLRNGIQDLGQLERTLDDWTGRAADSFALDFYQPLELVHANHCYLIHQSAKAMSMAIGVFETAQDAVMNAVVAARDVLDAQLRARAGGGGGRSSKEFLTVAAVAASVAGSTRFVSPPAATALGLASIGSNVLKEYAIDDDGAHETASIEAATADEAAAALLREVGLVRERSDRALSNLSGEFGPVRAEMSTMLASGRLHPPRPGLTADTPPAGFRFQFGGA